jgi:transcriptional regulator with XRE-family HTH domain
MARSGEPLDSVVIRPVGKLVGEAIAKLRRRRKLTLEALANGTGLTPSFLSKLERGQTSISVDNLRDIASFLGVEMVHFFSQGDGDRAIVTRRGGGPPLVVPNTNAVGLSLIRSTRSTLQATLYRTPRHQGRLTGFAHPGEEFVYVVCGRIRYWVAEQEYVLKAGDSIWHPSSEPHRWKNIGSPVAVTLHVNSPPVW